MIDYEITKMIVLYCRQVDTAMMPWLRRQDMSHHFLLYKIDRSLFIRLCLIFELPWEALMEIVIHYWAFFNLLNKYFLQIVRYGQS
jgi:hypothetical protein